MTLLENKQTKKPHRNQGRLVFRFWFTWTENEVYQHTVLALSLAVYFIKRTKKFHRNSPLDKCAKTLVNYYKRSKMDSKHNLNHFKFPVC